MKTTILTFFLAMLCCTAAKANTNVVTRTLPFSTNYSITYGNAGGKTDGVVVIFFPDYKSKGFQQREIHFNETQRSDIMRLLEKFVDLSITLENNDVKTFSKHLGSIPTVSEDLKLAIGLDATIYVSSEGKSLLILEKTEGYLVKDSSFLVLDRGETESIVELIKMIPPDLQTESSAKSSK
jgi:hypothetical protein